MKPLAETIDKLQGNVPYGYLLPSLISLKNKMTDIISRNVLPIC